VNLHWRQSRFISGAHKFTVEAPKALAKHRGDLEVRGRFPRIFFKIYAILTYVFYGAFLASSVYFWRGRYSSGPRFLLGSSPSLSPTSGLTHGVAPWTALAGRGGGCPLQAPRCPHTEKNTGAAHGWHHARSRVADAAAAQCGRQCCIMGNTASRQTLQQLCAVMSLNSLRL